jgi:hypothetical protein
MSCASPQPTLKIARFIETSALVIVSLISTQLDAARPVEFRIKTQIFVGDEKEPISEATTLFHDGVVYDFLTKPEQTAVFRKAAGDKPGRFILLDTPHGIQTEISTDELSGLITKLRAWAGKNDNAYLQFSANPKFEESFEADKSKLVLASHIETYTVTTTRSEHSEAIAEYREFLDWYTRLNALLSAVPMPPEPRLRLNAALARRNVIPLKVELSRTGEEPMRAEHDFTWRLSREDHDRIDDANNSRTAFRMVSNDEYRKTIRPTDDDK